MTPKTDPEERPIVQTVKIDSALYIKLKTYGARTRRSNQDIILTALTEYLQRVKA